MNRPSKQIHSLFLVAAVGALIPLSLSATAIGWGPQQNITDNSDVSTTGAFVQAANIAGNSTTVNGVTFDPFAITGGTVTSGHFSLSGNSGGSNVYGSGNPPFANLSPEYQSLLSTGNFGNQDSIMTLTIGGLTLGDMYQFQVWINDSRGAFGTQTVSATDGGSSIALQGDTTGMNGGTGQYALLTFLADGDETITFQGAPTGGTTEEAFQLRDLTGTTVPESGATMSLLGISLAGICFLRKKFNA